MSKKLPEGFVEEQEVPAKVMPGERNSKWKVALTAFIESDVNIASFDGGKSSTQRATYLKRVIAKHGFDLDVASRNGRVFISKR